MQCFIDTVENKDLIGLVCEAARIFEMDLGVIMKKDRSEGRFDVLCLLQGCP